MAFAAPLLPSLVKPSRAVSVLATRPAFAQRRLSSATVLMASAGNPPASALYAVLATDASNASSVRASTRPRHLDWATTEVDVFFGGPWRKSDVPASDPPAPVDGSLLIVGTDRSPDALDALLDTDPYVEAGVFASREVRQWVCGMRVEPVPKQLYMVWCVDRPDSLQLRKDTRPSHLDWWKQSGRKGLIGPFPCEGGACGSLILCSGDSVDEVRQWAASDPYNVAGLFESVRVCAFTSVIDRGALVP